MRRARTLLLLAGLGGLPACANLPHPVTSRDPLSPAEHVALGDAYLSHREKPAALQQYQAALDQDRRNVPALMALGNLAFEDHDWKRAQTYFNRALKAAPGNAGAVNNSAMVDLAEGKHLERASRRIDQVLPTAGAATPYLLDTSANIALREGRYADAQLALDRAEALAPRNDAEFQKQITESRNKLAAAHSSN